MSDTVSSVPPRTNSDAGNEAGNNQSTSRSGQQQQQRSGGPSSRRDNNNNSNSSNAGGSHFEGACTALKGHVFTMGGGPAQYPRVVEQLHIYSGTEYSDTPEITSFFNEPPVAPVIPHPGDAPRPTGPPDTGGNPTTTQFDVTVFETKVKKYCEKDDKLRGNRCALFLVIYGQCDPVIKSHLQSRSSFVNNRTNGDCLWLMEQIRGIVSRFDDTTYVHDSVHVAFCKFYGLHQGHRTTVEYYRLFQECVTTLDLNSAWSAPPAALNPVLPDANARRDAQLAAHFILNADNRRFAQLKADLRAQFARGTDQYPKTVQSAYRLLLTTETQTPDSRNAPEPTDSRRNASQRIRGHQYLASAHAALPDSLWLLDTLASHSLFKCRLPIAKIQNSSTPLELVTQAGTFTAQRHGMFTGFPDCAIKTWFHPDAVANVLALCDVRTHCRVTMDTAADPAMLVHTPKGTVFRFAELSNGLYAFDSSSSNASTSTTVTNYSAYSCLQTVSSQKAMFTARQLKGADKARELSRQLGRPSKTSLEHSVLHGHILNCPVTIDDIRRAELIYGPDIAFLKGHSVEEKEERHVPTFVPTPVPSHIRQHHNGVVLCTDFFYVQRLPFLHCVSRDLQYRHTFPVDNRNKETMLECVERVCNQYLQRGFELRSIHADNEFECIRDDVSPVHLDIVTANGHVPEIERSIRTMKEDARTVIHGMPFRRLPKVFVKHLIQFVTKNLNQLTRPNGGILEHASPDNIVLGLPKPDFRKLKIEFGSYVQMFDRTTNDIRARTVGAIVLDHTGNADGSYNMLSLRTGQVFTRTPDRCTVLPITDIAIRRFEQLAKAEGQPNIQDSNLLVEWRPDQPFDEDEFDVDFEDDDSNDSDGDDDDADYEPVEDDEVQDANIVHAPRHHPVPAPAPPAANANVDVDAREEPGALEEKGAHDDLVDANEAIEEAGAPAAVEVETVDEIEATEATEAAGAPPATDADTPAAATDTPPAAQPVPSHNLRGGDRQPDYSYRYGFLQAQLDTVFSQVKDDMNKTTSTIAGMMFNQMSARTGIKKHGDAARDALRKEFKQIVDKHVYSGIRKKDLTPEQLERVLGAVNLIKEKRNGVLKGRHCANGSKQRPWYEKHETSSPALNVDALILTLIVDAVEGRDVATADVAGAYLNAIMEEFVVLKLVGEDATLMCEVHPPFHDFLEYENGKPVLYLKLDRALYGCVQSALLWYKLFSSTLKSLGFVLNPYDPCVANAMIDGSQCTVAWYVDDNKISHVDTSVVDRIIDAIEADFGEMTKTRGDMHSFLGMDIAFDRDDKSVSIGMKSYLKEAIAESQLGICRSAATPATKTLFEIDPNSQPLVEAEARIFHSVVSKLLYVSLRGRPDLLVAISFLTTRVSAPTEQDQAKLRRLLEYINGTLELKLHLGAVDLATLYTFIDAAYGVHKDMRSQTGGVMSFGRGGFLSRASKQKINTKSSTEAELVGASDYLSNTIWAQNFMAAQGYPISRSFFEQDNESTLKMIKNGRASAGSRSKHIDIRYFWITDRLKTDNITARHCDTLSMLSDFLSKPLQGSLFRKFRDVLLGYSPLSSLGRVNDTSDSERVEGIGTKSQQDRSVTWSDVVRGTRTDQSTIQT